MAPLTTKDLREHLSLLLWHRQEDGEGGWQEQWQRSLHLWGSIWPLALPHGFHKGAHDPMMTQEGYVKNLPPLRYQLIIRAMVEIPVKSAFLWHLARTSKRLLVISKPCLIQYNRFLRMIVMEDKNE